MTDLRRITAALEAARHDLVALHNLGAFDQVCPAETFVIDNAKTLALLDRALTGLRSALYEPEFSFEEQGER